MIQVDLNKKADGVKGSGFVNGLGKSFPCIGSKNAWVAFLWETSLV